MKISLIYAFIVFLVILARKLIFNAIPILEFTSASMFLVVSLAAVRGGRLAAIFSILSFSLSQVIVAVPYTFSRAVEVVVALSVLVALIEYQRGKSKIPEIIEDVERISSQSNNVIMDILNNWNCLDDSTKLDYLRLIHSRNLELIKNLHQRIVLP